MIQSNLQYATSLIGAGYKVFPCCWPTPEGECGCGRSHTGHNIGKAPLTPHGHKDASSKGADVFNWWTKWPLANISIALDGFIMVDPDDDAAQAEVANWELPPTVKRFSRQPALLYRVPKDFPRTRLTKKGQSKQIDLLTDGYCLVGGTHMLGMPLSLDSLAEPAMAPNALIERFKGWMPAPIPEPTPVDPSGDPPVRLNREGQEWWLGVKYQPGANGVVDRSATLFKLGCILARAGATEGTIADALQERDSTLYGKYTDRRDAPIRYAEIARKGISNISSNGHHIPGDPGETIYTLPGEIPLSNEPPWEDIKELPQREPLPHLSIDMVPAVFRQWVSDTARQACFPLEMVAVPAIVAAAAVVGRKYGIKPWSFNDYIVVPNLWGALNARPASLKSFAISEALKPLKKLDIAAHDRFETAKIVAASEIAMLEEEAKQIKSEMGKLAQGKGGSGKTRASLKDELANKLDAIKKESVKKRTFWIADTTPERLCELMEENPNGLLISYDELAGWLAEMDRPMRGEGSRGIYLASWEGTGSHKVSRIGRGDHYIPACVLSVFGGIQPDRLKRHIDEALSGGKGGDGMIQRLQMIVTIEHLDEWEAPNQWPDTDAKKYVDGVFEWLNHPHFGGESDATIPFTEFSSEAQPSADLWKKELENKLRGYELARFPAFEAHMGKYRSLMPSLALIFHVLDMYILGYEPDNPLPLVSLEALEMAQKWCEYLESHARRIYEAELTPDSGAADRLADKINDGLVSHELSVRDLYTLNWAGLDTLDRVTPALRELESLGWLNVVKTKTGGRPTDIILLHPEKRP